MEINEEELDRMVDEVINTELYKLTQDHIAPYTCQLFVRENGTMKAHASGVFTLLNDCIYLLTALHVVKDFSDTNPLYFMIGEETFELNGTVVGLESEENRIDLGYIRLEEKLVLTISMKYKFLEIDRILFPEGFFKEPGFCVFGYPTQIRKGASYFVRSQPKKVYDYYGLNENDHYAMEFIGKATNIQTHKREKVRFQHYGLSGGGLWYTVLEQKGNRFKSQAYLVGIMTEFRTGKYPCLIGNRIHYFLHAMINSEELTFKFNSKFRNRIKRFFGKWPTVLRER